MAGAENQNRPGVEEGGEEERWAKYYCSSHEILLVGEGDFSFALSLAKSFGSASNILATSLDSHDVVIKKYKMAKSNLEMLEQLGASLLHEVDATKMKLHTDLQMRKFDRIIYNFPHAGFYGKENKAILIKKHRDLVHGFFKNASAMLRVNGEVHVNHKTTPPFCCWKIEELASQNLLQLVERPDFKREDYPGYDNKRGAGERCDDPFPLGKCSTFKFMLSSSGPKKTRSMKNPQFSQCKNHGQLQDVPTPRALRKPIEQLEEVMSNSLFSHYKNHGQPQGIPPCALPNPIEQLEEIVKPSSLELSWPIVNLKVVMDVVPGCGGSVPPANVVWIGLYRIFSRYFEDMVETFGKSIFDLRCSVFEALRVGFDRYKVENPGNPLNYYINLLQDFLHWSNLRLAFFQWMV